MTGEQTPFWTIDGAGLESGKTTASLTFEITHSGNIGGVKAVTRSLTYRDRAGHQLLFPSPSVTVNHPKPNPTLIFLVVPGCHDAVWLQLEYAVDDKPV